MTLRLRWTEQATLQLGAIAEHISLTSPIYAEQTVDRLVRCFDQACRFPQSGRMVPEFEHPDIRELIEPPYRPPVPNPRRRDRGARDSARSPGSGFVGLAEAAHVAG